VHDLTLSVRLEATEVDLHRAVVVAGPDLGASAPLEPPRIAIGTGPLATLRLNDKTVSRLHCEIANDAGRLRLRDAGSKNGTWLAGCRVIEAEVTAGTILRVGDDSIEIRSERTRLAVPRWAGGDRLGPMIGSSERMQELFAKLAQVAASDAPVLVTGESGTGKELVAHALHDGSPRRDGPFVVLDGSALSGSLAEMELFGHVRGAFTGAHIERAGAFERAHGGTLFIDELGEIPIDLQPKLLRALEDRTVQRLGDNVRRPVDFRLVAATNKSLFRMVADGSFREDLLHRILVVHLEVPPLRDRGSDVFVIARAMLDAGAGAGSRDPNALPKLEQALAVLAGYKWPGNVRELRSFVRRVALLGEAMHPELEREIEETDLTSAALPYADAKQMCTDAFERTYLRRLLGECSWNVSEAARRAQMNRGHLIEMMQRLGLKRPEG